MKTWKELKEEFMKDPKFREEYEKLQPEYRLMEAIIRRRIERKMTQKSLAQKLRTKQSAISRLESGTYNPTFKFLKQLAAALDCKLNISLDNC